jgi:catechol 2,3-dioxygenase-like lactoylglutathione lyase family enzyme
MKVVGLDHLVLTVASIPRTVDFYTRGLGMVAEQFGKDRRWALRFGPHKVNLHEQGREFEPKAHVARPGTADLCFLVDDLDAVKRQLAAAGVAPFEGPVVRTGARGTLTSYYLRDPDQNLIELSVYADGTKAAS